MRTKIGNRVAGRLALTIGMFLVAVNSMPQETSQPTVSKPELQRLYKDFLVGEAYRPEIDEDGDVRFKREGRSYFIAVDEQDPECFRVVLPNIWEIESEEERSQVLVAADESNRKSKVSKVFTVKDNVWVSVELFVARPEDFKGVFARAMAAIDNGVANFVSKMRE